MFPSGSCLARLRFSFEMTMLSPESAPRKCSTRSAANVGHRAFYCEPNVWRIGINSTLMCPPTLSPQIERHRVRAE